MWVLVHKGTGETQFVADKNVHDLNIWNATELPRQPTEFDEWNNGALVENTKLKDRRIADSELAGLSPSEIQANAVSTVIAQLESAGAITAEQAKRIRGERGT